MDLSGPTNPVVIMAKSKSGPKSVVAASLRWTPYATARLAATRGAGTDSSREVAPVVGPLHKARKTQSTKVLLPAAIPVFGLAGLWVLTLSPLRRIVSDFVSLVKM